MIGQILPNNNERCYSNFSPTFREVNTPSVLETKHDNLCSIGSPELAHGPEEFHFHHAFNHVDCDCLGLNALASRCVVILGLHIQACGLSCSVRGACFCVWAVL
jgi:hypothetical protein